MGMKRERVPEKIDTKCRLGIVVGVAVIVVAFCFCYLFLFFTRLCIRMHKPPFKV